MAKNYFADEPMPTLFTPTAAPVERPASQGRIGDTIDSLQSGGLSALGGMFDFIGAQGLAQSLYSSSNDQQAQMSERGREALGQQFIQEDEQGNFELGEGATDLDTWLLTMANVAGQFAGTVIPGAGAAGLAGKAASLGAKGKNIANIASMGATGGAAATGQGMEQARQEVQNMPDTLLAESPLFGDVFRGVHANQPELSNVEKWEAAKTALANKVAQEVRTDPKVLIANFGASAIGDPIIGKALTGARLAKSGALRSALAGFVTEGSNEAVQAGVQQLGVNQALQPIDNRDEMQGVVAAGLNEGLAGGGFGAAAGGIGGLVNRQPRQQTPQTEPTAEPAPQSAVDPVTEQMKASNPNLGEAMASMDQHSTNVKSEVDNLKTPIKEPEYIAPISDNAQLDRIASAAESMKTVKAKQNTKAFLEAEKARLQQAEIDRSEAARSIIADATNYLNTSRTPNLTDSNQVLDQQNALQIEQSTQQETFAGNESGVNVARNGKPFKSMKEARNSKLARQAKRQGLTVDVVPFDNGYGWKVNAPATLTDEGAIPQSTESNIESNAQPTANLAGDPINSEWTAFNEQSETKNIPRAEMPQIKAENRGAMVNFMNARDISHEQDEVPASSLKPTQQEFSPAKVKKAMEFEGGNRSILVSSDNYVLDGHHQWLAAREKGEPVKVIRLNAPIEQLVPLAKEMPSTETQDNAGNLTATGNEETATTGKLNGDNGKQSEQKAVKTAETGKLIEQEPAANEQANQLPSILKTTKRKWLQSEAKKLGIKKGSPGYDAAAAKIEESYEPAIDKALAESSFETYQQFNSDTPESINRQAYSELRKEFGLDDQPIEKPQEQKTVQANDTEKPNSSENKKVDDPVAAEPEANEQQSSTNQATVKQESINDTASETEINDIANELEIETTDKSVKVFGDPEEIRAKLRASGIDFLGADIEGGLSFGKKQEQRIRAAIEGDNIELFSKSKKPSNGKSISIKQAQRVADQFIKGLKGANGIKISILQDTATAEKLWRMSLDGATVKGAYSKQSKTVYIIAENIDNLTDLKQTLAHETIAHGGLDTVIGKEAKQEFLNRIKATKGRKAFEGLWREVNKDYWDMSLDVKVEEMFARFVENEPSKGELKYWWNALKRWIKAQLDKAGIMYREDDELTAMREMLESIVKGFKAQREPMVNNQAEMTYSQSDKKFSRTADNDTNPAPSKIPEAVKKVFNRESRFEKSSVPEWEALNAQLRETDKTAASKIKRELSRWFMPGGNMPETVKQATRGRDRDVAVHEFDVSMLVGKLNAAMKAAKINPDRLTDDQWSKYHQFLIGENDGQSLKQSERETLILMREHIDGLTQDYVASVNNKLQQRFEEDGSIDPKESARLEKMLGNIGKYLNRSYKAFDDPNWFEKIPTDVIDDARTYLMKQYKKDGATIEEAQQKAQVTMNEMVKTGTAYDSLGSFIAESKLGSKDLSTLIPRKDIAPEIRALLGEYADPRINYAKSVSKMSAMIANDKLLNTIRDMGINNFIFEKDNRPPNATVQLAGEKSEVYAPLNGMWTTPEIKEAFEDAMGGERGEGWLDKAIQINGFIKYGKTVLSPTTAMRNVMSSYFFTVANGHFNQKYMKQAVAAFNAQVKGKVTDGESDYMKRLIKLGVLYDSANAGEMVKMMTDGKVSQMLEGKSGAAFENLRWLTDKATGFYRFGDDFWKIVGFENEKAALIRTGMAESDAEVVAAERIQDTYPTYSRVGKAGVWLSRFPLAGTFVSFPAEIIRTTANMIKLAASEIKSDNPEIRAMGAKRVVGISLASGGMFALGALTKAMFGVTDDEEEALRDLAPPWQKNSTFLYAGRDKDGNLRYFDMTFMDPYAYWKRPIEAIMRNQPLNEAITSSIGDMVSPFLGTDISAGKLLEVVSNKKESGGQVYKENDTAIRQGADIAGHLALGLAPGAVNNAWRIGMAAADVKRSTGKPYSLSDEMLALAGFRSSTFDPKIGLYYRTFDFNSAIAEARKELSGVLRNPNKVSDDEISAAKERAKTKQEQAFKQMSRLIKAAETGGASRSQVVQIILLAGISKRNAGFLLRGQVPPVNLSDRSFESAVKRAQLIMDSETAKEVRSRFNRIVTP